MVQASLQDAGPLRRINPALKKPGFCRLRLQRKLYSSWARFSEILCISTYAFSRAWAPATHTGPRNATVPRVKASRLAS
jgi:hypothetical protein